MKAEIIDFWKTRLDEKEQTARAAGESRIAWLTYLDDEGQMRYTTVAAEAMTDVWIANAEELPVPARAMVVYDPARVLREIDGDRKLIEKYEKTITMAGVMRVEPDHMIEDLHFAVLCRVMQYDHHPDYNLDWVI